MNGRPSRNGTTGPQEHHLSSGAPAPTNLLAGTLCRAAGAVGATGHQPGLPPSPQPAHEVVDHVEQRDHETVRLHVVTSFPGARSDADRVGEDDEGSVAAGAESARTPTRNPATKPNATQTTANLSALPALNAIHICPPSFRPVPTNQSSAGRDSGERVAGFPAVQETGNGRAGERKRLDRTRSVDARGLPSAQDPNKLSGTVRYAKA
jgi:hypothetical protein